MTTLLMCLVGLWRASRAQPRVPSTPSAPMTRASGYTPDTVDQQIAATLASIDQSIAVMRLSAHGEPLHAIWFRHADGPRS